MKTIEEVISYLNSEDLMLRRRAMWEAQEIGSPEADAIIFAGLRDSDRSIRYQALEAIAYRGEKISIDRAEITDTLLEMLHNPSSNGGISGIAEALFRLGFSNHEMFIDLMLRDPSYDISTDISDDLLLDTDYREVAEQSFRVLVKALGDDEELVRERAVYVVERTLCHCGRYDLPDDISESLVILLNSEYPYVRATAAELLTFANSDVSSEPLLKKLDDEDVEVRLAAMYVLGQHGYSSDPEPIFQLGSSHEDADVRFMAAKALSVLAPSRFVELVAMGTVNSLNDGQYNSIAMTLQHMGGKDIPKENIDNAMTKLWESNQLNLSAGGSAT